MEEALQAGKPEIAEYLAPRTTLSDDKTYSVIPESAFYEDEGDEEEKRSAVSDVQSLQSEEGIRQEDY